MKAGQHLAVPAKAKGWFQMAERDFEISVDFHVRILTN
jgi:hypothetical protein